MSWSVRLTVWGRAQHEPDLPLGTSRFLFLHWKISAFREAVAGLLVLARWKWVSWWLRGCLGKIWRKIYFESFLISVFVLVEMASIHILLSSVSNCTWIVLMPTLGTHILQSLLPQILTDVIQMQAHPGNGWPHSLMKQRSCSIQHSRKE